MSDPTTTELRDDVEQHRFELVDGGEIVAIAAYRLVGTKKLILTHTEVDPGHEGKGYGSAIAKGVVDAVLAREGLTLVPACPFLRAWLERHPEIAEANPGRISTVGLD